MDRRAFLLATPGLALAGCVSVGGAAGPPAPAPVIRVGDRWVYHAADGFRNPVTWTETHEVVSMDGAGFDVRVTLEGPPRNYVRTERFTAPGIMTVGSVYDPVETRHFESPVTVFQFPLTPGTSWNQNLRNLDPANGLVSQINRNVHVGGYEQVGTPAGSFNAIAMRILMTVDDNNPFRWPVQCNYMVWWAPEVGAMVRMTKFATYRERGDGPESIQIRAQNTVIELVSFRRA
jgi:hypothetical protein